MITPMVVEPSSSSSAVSAVTAAILPNLSLAPSAQLVLTKEKVQELFEKGIKLMNTGYEAKAAEHWRQAAEACAPEDQFNWGLMYLDGAGVKKHCPLAVQLITQAANANIAAAQFCLGRMYYDGTPVRQDVNRGLELFIAAAKQDFPEALRKLGLCYLQGEALKEDHPKALKFLEKAASLGDAESQFLLGDIFYYGKWGVTKDLMKALAYFIESSKQGHDQSMVLLMHSLGPALFRQNWPISIELLRRAKLEGSETAQKILNDQNL